ncbi:MAG: putative endonuclease [Methylophilaceae bacterium]|jgi:putative endonuclease
MKINKNHAGAAAEQLAATFLMQKGLKLVVPNYHCRFGEIDLVMKDGNTLVFVEVRSRSNDTFGSASVIITKQKQQKLIATAQHFLQMHQDCDCCFDPILMNKAHLDHIEWLRNVFETKSAYHVYTHVRHYL